MNSVHTRGGLNTVLLPFRRHDATFHERDTTRDIPHEESE